MRRQLLHSRSTTFSKKVTFKSVSIGDISHNTNLAQSGRCGNTSSVFPSGYAIENSKYDLLSNLLLGAIFSDAAASDRC